VGSIAGLAKKYRRALRNDQGTRFTADELQQLANIGLLEMISSAENEELRAKWAEKSASTPLARTGSASGRNPRSSRSHGMTRKQELRGIEALVAGS
jgi:hypothetical protein